MALTGPEFEDEVRRIARALWPGARYQGATTASGRERDGLFEEEFAIHLIEATTLRTKDKAKQDIDKLKTWRAELSGRGSRKPVFCWFVTLHEPTNEQRALAPKDLSFRVVSFEQFRAQLVDAHAYLRDRDRVRFGSALDPATGSSKVDDEYLPLRIEAMDGRGTHSASIASMSEATEAGTRLVLLGDYGAGKSMTMRELFRSLASAYRQGRSARFPIHLNLREHYGQDDPVEALHRHARKIGFEPANQLVRAWRAGYAHVLLDGFDEMSNLAGPATRLREVRRGSVILVRNFFSETPREVGIVVAGRSHFFDSAGDMQRALGLPRECVVLQIADFDDEQVAVYLKRRGWSGSVPSWLPSRPLLVGYLAHEDLLSRVLQIPAGTAPAAAWDALLDLVCDREALVDPSIDGAMVRRVVEALASIARERTDQLGPLDMRDMEDAWREACGRTADDRALVLLQRLPGLGPMDEADGTRRFVDQDLADVAAAGDLARTSSLLVYRAQTPTVRRWRIQLGDLSGSPQFLSVTRG